MSREPQLNILYNSVLKSVKKAGQARSKCQKKGGNGIPRFKSFDPANKSQRDLHSQAISIDCSARPGNPGWGCATALMCRRMASGMPNVSYIYIHANIHMWTIWIEQMKKRPNKCIATRNKSITTSNKKLLVIKATSSNAVVTSSDALVTSSFLYKALFGPYGSKR